MIKHSFLPFATAAVAFALASAPAAAVVYANPAAIGLVDDGEAVSDITIAGTTGTITNMTLSLVGLGHTYPDDLVMGLLNESAGIGFVFMSHVGGSLDISGIDLTFSDAATTQLPESFVSFVPVTSGTYLPSNFGGFQFTAFDSATSFADFNGLSANGTWTLVVADTFPADTGSIAGGWSLDITTSAAAFVPEPGNWAMLIAGFGLVGATARRRRDTAVAV